MFRVRSAGTSSSAVFEAAVTVILQVSIVTFAANGAVPAQTPAQSDGPDPVQLDAAVRGAVQFGSPDRQQRPDRLFIPNEGPSGILDFAPQTHGWSSRYPGEEFAVYLPGWQVTDEMPVDLIFDVTVTLKDTAETFECDSVDVKRGESTRVSLRLKNTRLFATRCDGVVPLTITLTSRPSETDNSQQTVWEGTITSDVLKAKAYYFKPQDATPVVRRLREQLSELAGVSFDEVNPDEVRKALQNKGFKNADTYTLLNMGSLNPYNRRRGVGSIDAQHGSEYLPLLMELLDDEELVAEQVFRTLQSIGTATIPAVAKRLPDASPEKRVRIILMWNDMADNNRREAMTPLVVPHLLPLLEHHHIPTRQAVAHALHRFPDDRAVDPLIRALGDESSAVRTAAATALASNRSERAIPALLQSLDDEDDRTRQEVMSALIRFGRPELRKRLERALREDPFYGVRQHAAWGLANTQDKRTIPALQDALIDPHRKVVVAAILGLTRLKDDSPVTLDLLIQSLRRDPDIRREAARALQTLTGENFGDNPSQWEDWYDANILNESENHES